ncbi:MAG: hypothetical protein ACREDR_43100, partial [Blastocatellia bacterium]
PQASHADLTERNESAAAKARPAPQEQPRNVTGSRGHPGEPPPGPIHNRTPVGVTAGVVE